MKQQFPSWLIAIAWRIKEKLRWIRQADSPRAARWRITNFLRHARELLDPNPILDPVRRALATFEEHSQRILERWTSTHRNARVEGLNAKLPREFGLDIRPEGPGTPTV